MGIKGIIIMMVSCKILIVSTINYMKLWEFLTQYQNKDGLQTNPVSSYGFLAVNIETRTYSFYSVWKTS
jgi:hypothetical protein